jgi:hypothetical protein
VTCEKCDTVRELAEMVRLDPEEFKKWLLPKGEAKLPATADEPIPGAWTFTVPNIVYITYGDSTPPLMEVKPGIVANMNAVESDYRGKGYRVYHFNPGSGYAGHSLTFIQRTLQQPDIAIWAHGGHGTMEGLRINEGGSVVRGTAANLTPHHGLSEVILYACYQGGLAQQWFTILAPKGILRAWPQPIKAGRWNGLPYEWMNKYEKPASGGK